MRRKALGISVRLNERIDLSCGVTILITKTKPSKVNVVILAPEEVLVSRPGTFGRDELSKEEFLKLREEV